jgi:hypothetical protein
MSNKKLKQTKKDIVENIDQTRAKVVKMEGPSKKQRDEIYRRILSRTMS